MGWAARVEKKEKRDQVTILKVSGKYVVVPRKGIQTIEDSWAFPEISPRMDNEQQAVEFIQKQNLDWDGLPAHDIHNLAETRKH